ncbi:velvet factor-domain-containing protein [Phlyctochytrium arcticum]|nr:velvet factor-domain-containing protein [Phlyctochytrium arcticum]
MTPQPQRDRDRDRDRERGRQQAEEPTTGKAITGTHHTPYTFVPHTEYLDNDTHSGNRQYHLVVRQQPERARACGYADRADRRPLDPPPVAQLHVTDRRTGQVYADTLHNPYYMCYATLYHATLDHEILPSTSPTSPQSHPLNGTVVTSMARLKDENHVDGAYFVFCNLGVKAEGRYRVLFTLFEISGGAVHCRARTLTEPFYVYGKSFPGMAESTPLCRCFAEQGVRLRVRNEPKLRRFVFSQANMKMYGAKDYRL